MKRILRIVAMAGAGSLMLAAFALSSPASAAGNPQPTCGGTVTTNVTMTGNLSCSGRNSGITVADGKTLDCNGHSITGDPTKFGDGPGITVHSNSTVMNCTVKFFDAGIYLSGGGSDNVIKYNTVQDNITSGNGNFGDGILLDSSSNNQILGNVVNHNGPFDGIGLIGRSNDNLIQYNAVSNNNIPSTDFAGHGVVNQDDGIRIEGPGSQRNQVLYNTVSGSGLEGIAVFGNQGTNVNNSNNVISGNTVTGNGFNTLNRQGSGIRLFLTANKTTITNNTVSGNAASGIQVDSVNNTITGNSASGNGSASSEGTAFDLYDTNNHCDNNAWHANTYGTAQPACAGAA